MTNQRVSDERLAAFCEPVGKELGRGAWVTELALDLRDARAEEAETHALNVKLSDILSRAAIALRGPEPPLTRWSFHDVPDLINALKSDRLALVKLAVEAGMWDAFDEMHVYDSRIPAIAARVIAEFDKEGK